MGAPFNQVVPQTSHLYEMCRVLRFGLLLIERVGVPSGGVGLIIGRTFSVSFKL